MSQETNVILPHLCTLRKIDVDTPFQFPCMLMPCEFNTTFESCVKPFYGNYSNRNIPEQKKIFISAFDDENDSDF